MTIPAFSVVLIVLAFVALALGSQPGKGWAVLAMLLLLCSGAWPVYTAFNKVLDGREPSSMAMGAE